MKSYNEVQCQIEKINEMVKVIDEDLKEIDISSFIGQKLIRDRQDLLSDIKTLKWVLN